MLGFGYLRCFSISFSSLDIQWHLACQTKLNISAIEPLKLFSVQTKNSMTLKKRCGKLLFPSVLNICGSISGI